MKVVSFKLSEEDADYLEYLSKKTGIPKSEIIRKALQNYFNAQKDKPFVTKRLKIYT